MRLKGERNCLAERNSDSCFLLYEFVLGEGSSFLSEVHVSTCSDLILETYENDFMNHVYAG